MKSTGDARKPIGSLVLSKIMQSGLFIEVPGNNVDKALKRIRALTKGGIRLIGIDIRHSKALRIVEESAARFADRLVICADFALDSGAARRAILAGADIVSTPYLNREVLTLCNRYGKICMPGALTPTEVLKAIEWGASLVKLFPADLLGPGLLKALKGPLPHAQLIPSAGVHLGNMSVWFRAGACAVMLDGIFGKAGEEDPEPSDEKITLQARKLTECFENTAPSIQNPP